LSDQPLFQNADEQEEAYAPQQLPAGSPQQRDAAVEEGGAGRAGGGGAGVVVPGAMPATMAGGGVAGNLESTSTTMGGASVGPAIAGAALAGDVSREHDATDTGSGQETTGSTSQTAAG